MKKTLIALAAVAAATGAMAQSTVTISGVFDIGYGKVNDADNSKDASRVAQNGSATSAIVFAGTEDLGGGLTARFRYEANPDLVNGAGLASTASGSNGYNFVGVSSTKFGQVLLGRLNTSTLATWGVANRFGTAMGSGYANTFGRQSTGADPFETTPTRFNGAIEYTSPTFSGVTVRFMHVPKVDNASGNNDTTGANRAGVQDIGVTYAAGPLTVAYSRQQAKRGANGIGSSFVPTQTGLADANSKQTYDLLAARYVMGDITVRGGIFNLKRTTNGAVDATNGKFSGQTIGASYQMGQIELSAQYTRSNDKSTSTDVDRKIIGLGADYAFSKRTAAYVRYESYDANTVTAANDKVKTTHVGIRHSF